MTKELEAALDRQFRLVLAATDSRLFLHRLTALWAFLTTEPLVAAVVQDAVTEAKGRTVQFEALMTDLAAEALRLLATHRKRIQRFWPRKGTSLKALEEHLRSPGKVKGPEKRSSVGSAIRLLFGVVANEIENRKKAPDYLYVLRDFLNPLHDRCEHAERALRTSEAASGGFAADRLRDLVELANPIPRDGPMRVMHAKMAEWAGVARELHERGSTGKLDERVQAARPDVETLREDLQLRLVLGRSRLALVRRFAGRCERYGADEPRTLCETASSSRKKSDAEHQLTMQFARYLYDQGLNPLVDPKIAGLRPDVYDPVAGRPFYVEAKQYDSTVTDGSLRKKMRGAITQVLDTWGSLTHQEPVPEAFLLVFRRGGPRLEVPELLRVESRRLYLVVADIAPASESGSRNKLSPVRMDAAMLLGDFDKTSG